MKKTIVYILSTNYAGSHFLSLLLGSHSRALHLGEVKRLRKKNQLPEKQLCFMCGDTNRCPVFKGTTPHNIEDVYEIVFANTGQRASVLVDASKKIFWARRFLNDDRYKKKYIHLVRDPRALVRRWQINRPTMVLRKRALLSARIPDRAVAILFQEPMYAYMFKWLEQNSMITEFIKRPNRDAVIVTYHDLACKTESVVQQLMSWLDLSYEPGQTAYWNFEHHGSQKQSYEWLKKKQISYFDVRWQNCFSRKEQDRIINDTHIHRYLENLGLQTTDTGLCRSVFM